MTVASQITPVTGTTAARAAATRVLATGERFLDTDTGRSGVGDGATVPSLLGHIKGTRYDAGETLVAKLDSKFGTGVVYVAGDSTGAINTRWPRRLLTSLAAAYTDAAVTEYASWDDTAKTYTTTVIQAGTTGGALGIRSRDTFNRTSADLIGSTADTGQAWAQSATNSQGDFSVNPTDGLVRSSDTATAVCLLDSGSAGDRIVTLAGITNWSSVATGTSINMRLYTKFVDASNNVYGQVSISSTGVVTWLLAKTIGGVATTMQAGSGSPLVNNTAGQSITSLKVTVAGTAASFEIVTGAGTFTASGTLAAGDVTTLNSATKDGIQSGPVGYKVSGSGTNGFTVNVTGSPSPLLAVTMYNGSYTGSQLSLQQPQLAAQCPVAPDLVLINSCHNYGSNSPAAYLLLLDQFINKVLSTWPNTGIAVMSQNPQKPPAVNQTPHLLRNQAIRRYCRDKGIDYIPVVEAFRGLGDGGASLVRADGIHPTDNTDTADAANGVASANGAQLWGRVVWAWLRGKSLVSAPTS